MDLNRIAELAKQDAGCKFHSIAHFLTKEALWGAFDGLRRGAAAGVDGVTYANYEDHVVEKGDGGNKSYTLVNQPKSQFLK